MRELEVALKAQHLDEIDDVQRSKETVQNNSTLGANRLHGRERQNEDSGNFQGSESSPGQRFNVPAMDMDMDQGPSRRHNEKNTQYHNSLGQCDDT